jgi:succinate dehydrogenase / fumarate reductase cytochrome b subunit|tara:strand:+ start:233 stop:517 length:285 start_codon:yes stop_codon:yes gene_type:complete
LNRVTTFLNSSIGKKTVVATTGFLLFFFLIIHLVGNFTLFGGASFFNNYVLALSSFKPLVRTLEIVLVLIFGSYISNGLRLSFENMKVTGKKYL